MIRWLFGVFVLLFTCHARAEPPAQLGSSAGMRHGGRISSLSMSADGKLLACGGDDKRARVFDASGALLAEMIGHEQDITAVALSPAGDLLATASWAGDVRLWEPRTGQSIEVIPRQGDGTQLVVALAFSPDGKRLAIGRELGTFEGAVDVRAARGGGAPERWKMQKVRSLAWAPDGTWLAVGVGRGQAIRVTAATGQQTPWDLPASCYLTAMAFDRAGTRLAIADANGGANVITLATGQLLALPGTPDGGPPSENVRALAWSPDGRFVAGTEANRVTVWDAASAEVRAKPLETAGLVTGLVFAPDGARLYAAGQDRSIHVLGAPSFAEIVVGDGHTAPITALLAAADGTTAASTSQDGTIKTWDLRDGRCLSTNRTTARASTLARRKQGGLAVVTAAGAPSTEVVFGPAGGGAPFATLTATDPITIEALAAGSGRAAAGSRNGPIRMWDVASGRLLFEVRAFAELMLPLPGGQLACVTPGGFTVLDASNGKTVHEHVINYGMEAAAASPDGAQLVIGSRGYGAKNLRTLDTATGALKTTLTGLDDDIASVAWSPDGRWIAAGGRSGKIGLWKATGELVRKFPAHTGHVTVLTVTADSGTLLSGGADGTIKLWPAP